MNNYDVNDLYIKFNTTINFDKCIKIPELNIIIGKDTEIGADTIIRSNVVINSEVTIGNKCHIGNFVLIREGVKIGYNTKIGAFNAIETKARIGDNVRTQGHCMISEYSEIGNNVFLGPHFNSMGDNTIGAPVDEYIANPPIIGDNCRFGSATKIIPGINISRGTITGAMTLLTKDTEPNSFYLGIPGKKIKTLTKDLII